MTTGFVSYLTSPIGPLKIVSSNEAIVSISFIDRTGTASTNALPSVHQRCRKQLEEYFAGQRTQFTLPLGPSGTPFQQKVWKALQDIPCGGTVSYLQLAETLGNKKSIRAVGRANGRNEIAIVIPCHRVIGSNGQLIGYEGGLHRKEWLLRHEGALDQLTLFDPLG